MRWYEVCGERELPHEYGVAVLVGDHGVAVFRTADEELFAVGNVDPFSGVGVIGRGIVGDRDGEPTVSSPMHEHVFSLRSGVCLDEAAVVLPAYPVRRRHGVVEIATDRRARRVVPPRDAVARSGTGDHTFEA